MQTMTAPFQIHGTTVSLDGAGLLLRGPSGSGKSDLALRLIDQGARLVADDRTNLLLAEGALVASAPASIRGLLEVRGIGLLSLPALTSVSLALVVDLVAQNDEPRMPEPAFTDELPVALPRFALWPFAVSAPIKIRHALATLAVRPTVTALAHVG